MFVLMTVLIVSWTTAIGVSVSAKPEQTQDHPPNWNTMSADEQARWLCRNDPSRCKSEAPPSPRPTPSPSTPTPGPCVRPTPAGRVDLRVGDPAPEFCFVDANGRTYGLRDYKGKAVVVVWFSATVSKRGAGMIYQSSECQGLRDARSYLDALNVAYFMVSTNSPQENLAFWRQWCTGGTFPILTDTQGRSAAAYGVLRHESGIDPSAILGAGAGQVPRGGFAFANTTYIGPDGRILYLESEDEVGQHLRGYGRDVAERLRQLGVKTTAELSAPAPAPKTVELGQTPEQVEAIMGKPETVAKLGPKVIYSYRALKVIFTNGKVSDVQ
jgi:peroxiredoxin